MDPILVVPGLRGSGPGHWQSWIEGELTGALRVQQADWDQADLPRWSGRLLAAIAQARAPVWLIAHSFGCLAAAHALPSARDRIAGMMLVAPADPDKFGISALIPMQPFDVPSVVVASTNDPWLRFLRAAWLADAWGSRLINLGPAGHINAQSGFGPWPDGLAIFQSLRGAADGAPTGSIEAAQRHWPG